MNYIKRAALIAEIKRLYRDFIKFAEEEVPEDLQHLWDRMSYNQRQKLVRMVTGKKEEPIEDVSTLKERLVEFLKGKGIGGEKIPQQIPKEVIVFWKSLPDEHRKVMVKVIGGEHGENLYISDPEEIKEKLIKYLKEEKGIKEPSTLERIAGLLLGGLAAGTGIYLGYRAFSG